MIRCNPTQFSITQELANQLAEAGIAEGSLDWFRATFNLASREGATLEPSAFLDYATQLYIAGHGPEADQITSKVLEANPTDPDAWFMKLAFHRVLGQAVAYDQELSVAQTVFTTRASAAAKRILGRADRGRSFVSACRNGLGRADLRPRDAPGARRRRRHQERRFLDRIGQSHQAGEGHAGGSRRLCRRDDRPRLVSDLLSGSAG